MSKETPLCYYTGVGSRNTPALIMDRMVGIGQSMANSGWVLRSGGANGADTAFEVGCNAAGGCKEIYLPWSGFNGHNSPLTLSSFSEELLVRAQQLAKSVHPAWSKLRQPVRNLHTRNMFQVLGQDLDTPSAGLICWTVDGRCIGGTATAIRLAQRYNIPIINLGAD